MPVPPSTVGRYTSSYSSSYSSYSSYRSPSSYLSRTTSLDRTPLYSSTYSKYSSRPPRSNYSDSHTSTRSLKLSPVRTFSRLNSDSKLTESSEPRYGRYRDTTSSSRDSGYGSRFTSRDRSVDILNGNSDSSRYTSYASKYRWEEKDMAPYLSKYRWGGSSANDEADEKVRVSREAEVRESEKGEGEKVRVSERIREFETRLDLENNDLRTRSRETAVNGGSEERRPSVSDLCRKYDSNHNVPNGVLRSDEEEDLEDEGARDLFDQKDNTELRKRIKVEEALGPQIADVGADTPNDRAESPEKTEPCRETPQKEALGGELLPPSATNGTSSKPKTRVDLEPQISELSLSARSRLRRDRVRERIAARLANELEEDTSPYPSRKSPPPCGSGAFSENGGLVGLRNIGNTCFLNSITQCLSNTRCLMEYLVRDGFASDINITLSTMRGELVRAFASLLTDMWRDGADGNRALNTSPFKSQVQKFAPVFSGYQQHDAQEFLRKLLEGLHEDVNRVAAKPRPLIEDIDDSLDDDKKAMESWKRYLRYDDSKIVDMFVGQLKSSLHCSVCGHRSVTFDPFWDLSLPIPSKSGQVRLYQCLDLFTKEEVLDGDERPTCSKCKERRKMTKSFSIHKFPKVLVLHLKRFSPLERWRGKLSCTVEFPLDGLDLSRYAAKMNTSCVYKLVGVANHSGTTYSGHYTAYCRHPYTSTWHEYNDSRISSISSNRICSPEAYVLFYELSSSSSKL